MLVCCRPAYAPRASFTPSAALSSPLGRGTIKQMRRTPLVAVAALVAILSCSTIAEADPNDPIATASDERTYSPFGGGRYKPASFAFGAHELITGMAWSSWGKRVARGEGTYRVNDCVPSCADGTITPTPASVVLTGRQKCGKRFVFRRVKVFFGGQRRGTPYRC